MLRTFQSLCWTAITLASDHVRNVPLALSPHHWPVGVDVDHLVREVVEAWDFPRINIEVVYTGILSPDFPNEPNIRDFVNAVYIGEWDEDFVGETKRRLTGTNTLQEFDIRIESTDLDAFLLQKTLMHELGHVYGLEHSQRIDAVMFPGMQARHSFTREISASGNHKITRDDVVNLYIREMEAFPANAAQLLETLNLIISFIPKNTGELVRYIVSNQTIED